MARRGLYDHLGGGFHRYCVDGQWTIPHFEKMLYDQGLLLRVYTELYRRARGADELAWPIRETVEYLRREMTAPDGGFYASQDADSEGEEGKSFVWTPEQVRAVLSERADAFCQAYSVSEAGNFENGTTHLVDAARQPRELFADERAALLAARSERIAQARPAPARVEIVVADERRHQADRRHAGVDRRIQQRFDALVADGENGQVRNLRQCVDRPVRFDARDRVVSRVHRVEASGVATTDQVLHRVPADSGFAVRGTDDGDRSGSQQRIEAVRGRQRSVPLSRPFARVARQFAPNGGLERLERRAEAIAGVRLADEPGFA